MNTMPEGLDRHQSATALEAISMPVSIHTKPGVTGITMSRSSTATMSSLVMDRSTSITTVCLVNSSMMFTYFRIRQSAVWP